MKLKEGQKITLIVVGIFIAVGLFYYLVFTSLAKKAPPISRHSYLVINLAGEIPERSVPDPFQEMFTGKVPSVQDIIYSIRKAKIDRKIEGIILRPSFSGMGWGKAEEIRDALLNFKESEKPIYAFLELAGNKEYYLATAADTIVGVNTGVLSINGLMGSALFLKGTLEKLGIEPDFIAYGKYKSAPEIFTRRTMSDALREVINSILDDMFPRFIRTVANARNFSEARVRQLVDQGFFPIQDARKVGLIDTVMFYNDFKEHLKKRAGKRARFVSLSRYKEVPMSKLGVKAKEKIAVVYGIGTIVMGSEQQFGQDGLITSEGMANSIRKAAKNKSVKAIVLRIDSPGGSGTASEIIWREVVEARKKKPVIVSVSDLAASGGYYISMAADSIVAHPSSIVGSIGVFMGKFMMKEMYRKIGMNKEEIKRGQNADLFSEIKKFSPEQRKLMEQYIMDFYRDFVNKVAEGRHMTFEDVDRIAQGRVWTGKQGLEIGLVDRLGDFSVALRVAKKMAGIPEDEPVKLLIYPRQKTFFERLLSRAVEANTWINISQLKLVPKPFRVVVQALPLFGEGEPLFLSPYLIEIN